MYEIEQFDPCNKAVKYRSQFDSFEDAWQNCSRGDWMLWIAQELKVNIRTLTLAKGLCAETVKHLMKDERSIVAVEKAIAFGKGEIGMHEFKQVCVAAADAARAAYYAAADAAAYAAAAATHAAAAAYNKNRKATADICRSVLTDEVFKLLEICPKSDQ